MIERRRLLSLSGAASLVALGGCTTTTEAPETVSPVKRDERPVLERVSIERFYVRTSNRAGRVLDNNDKYDFTSRETFIRSLEAKLNATLKGIGDGNEKTHATIEVKSISLNESGFSLINTGVVIPVSGGIVAGQTIMKSKGVLGGTLQEQVDPLIDNYVVELKKTLERS